MREDESIEDLQVDIFKIFLKHQGVLKGRSVKKNDSPLLNASNKEEPRQNTFFQFFFQNIYSLNMTQ